jgi:NTP pyrophosphatase (non-canonical NTP hydrolase)
MNRQEHLLTILAEECAEVAQRASKALRFGLGEVQPGQSLTNAERIVGELTDLFSVVSMLVDEEHINLCGSAAAEQAKRAKVEKFLQLSEQLGTLTK